MSQNLIIFILKRSKNAHYNCRYLVFTLWSVTYSNINIDIDVTTRSLTGFSKHIKSNFLSWYSLRCDIRECYACNNSKFPYFSSSCLHTCPFNYLLPFGIIYSSYCKSRCTVQNRYTLLTNCLLTFNVMLLI